VSDGLDSTKGEDDGCAKTQEALDNAQDSAVKICFSAAGLGGVRTSWAAVLWQERLYVSVTGSQLADGSKRAFVSLLEYAEEELGVTHVVACLDKLHHDNKNVIRNFLFLGFQPLTPGLISFYKSLKSILKNISIFFYFRARVPTFKPERCLFPVHHLN